MFHRLARPAFFMAAACVLAACEGVATATPVAEPDVVPATGVTRGTALSLDAGTLVLPIGTRQRMNTTLRGSRSRSVRWSSSATNIAKVDNSGRVTIVGEGLVTITASGSGDSESWALLGFDPQALTLSVAPGSLALRIGERQALSVSAVTRTGIDIPTTEAALESVDPSIAVVSGPAEIIGARRGSTRLNVTLYEQTRSVPVSVDGGTLDATTPVLTRFTMSPRGAMSVAPGDSRQFTTSAEWSDGITRFTSVTFSATGGTISASGAYSAPTSPGTYQVIAAAEGSTMRDTALITVATTPTGATLVEFRVDPTSVTLAPGGTQWLHPTARWSDGSTRMPAFTWSMTGGTLDVNTGIYTAPSTPGTYNVYIHETGGTRTFGSVITVTGSNAPTLTEFRLDPASVTLAPRGTQQYWPSARWTDGSTRMPPFTWSITGGTINTATGLYTAPATPGTYQVTIHETGGTRAFGSVVTVTGTNTGTTPTVTGFSLSPSSVTMAAGTDRQFTSTATWSDGATRNVSVTYQASGGTVSSTGLFTAGQVAGTFGIIAACSCGMADTSVINVTAVSTPQLVSLDISPKTVTLAPGASQAFSASARWSTGATTLPPVTFSATGGSVNPSTGTYIAPSSPGTYRVIVAHTGGSMRDTAVVTVQAVATPALTQLNLSPASLTLAAGGTAVFSTSALWSNGSTTVPSITYSATGGSITSGGLYTAPATAGTYRVIVAHSGGTLRDTSTVTVQASAPPPPPPSGGFVDPSHFPSDLRFWFDDDLDNMAQDEYPNANRIRLYMRGAEWRVQDATTPYSDGAVRQFLPGNSTGDGYGVGIMLREEGVWPRQYSSVMVKFEGSGGEPYKVHYNEEKTMFTRTAVVETGALDNSGPNFGYVARNGRVEVMMQNGLGSPRLYQNLPVYFQVGQWQKVEHYIQANTPGNSDGIWRMWINGQLAANHTNVLYSNNGSQVGFLGIRWETVRGGGTDNGPTPAGGQSRIYDRVAVYVSETIR